LVYSLRCAIERASVVKELQQGEIQYRQLVELSPDAFIVHQHGQIIFCNSATLKLLGVDRLDQLLSRPLEDFVHPDYRHLVQARIKHQSRRPAANLSKKNLFGWMVRP
jgi:PAS domain S-box-containing protein